MTALGSVQLEAMLVTLALVTLLSDAFRPTMNKRSIGLGLAALVALVLLYSFTLQPQTTTYFHGMYRLDTLSLYFKRLFLVATLMVLVMGAEFAERFESGVAEFYSLVLLAATGMLLTASVNDFILMFVALELVTITFYVLTSFLRRQLQSLEAGTKYLILGALSSAFMVFGIALIWGTTGTLNFTELAAVAPQFETSRIFLLGVLLVLVGLGFKIAAFPFQIWAPDVYQGAPTPTTAFLAVGSKAAGFVLLLRVLFTAVPSVTLHWEKLLIVISAITILYGNLCALPQRNLKRLLGYSSISHAGYLLLGVAALNASGQAAILYYLAGYLFTTLAGFLVIALVLRHLDTDDVSGLAGLSQRSPLLAATMTISMASLAGIPPLAGFFGKFLLLKSVVEAAKVSHGHEHGYYWLVAIALAGVVISLYYYFNVVRAIYWSRDVKDVSPITLSASAMVCAWVCIGGIFWLGLFPNTVLNLANQAVVIATK